MEVNYSFMHSELKPAKNIVSSPQGDLRVVMRSTLVGILTGPLTLSIFSLAPRTKPTQKFSNLFLLSEERVMRILCNASNCGSSKPNFPGFTTGGIVIAIPYNRSPNTDTNKIAY